MFAAARVWAESFTKYSLKKTKEVEGRNEVLVGRRSSFQLVFGFLIQPLNTEESR